MKLGMLCALILVLLLPVTPTQTEQAVPELTALAM